MTVLLVTVAVVLLVQLGFLWKLTRTLGRLQVLEERVGHFADAMALLTETADAGFRSMAGEIERLGTSDRHARAARAVRIADALRHGQPISEVAANEHVSEGEVRLRLHLGAPVPDTVHDAPVAKPNVTRPRSAPAPASRATVAAARASATGAPRETTKPRPRTSKASATSRSASDRR